MNPVHPPHLSLSALCLVKKNSQESQFTHSLMYPTHLSNNQAWSLTFVAGIMPATGDKGRIKCNFCLQGVIAGNAVGEGKNNTWILWWSANMLQGQIVVYEVDSWNHNFFANGNTGIPPFIAFCFNMFHIYYLFINIESRLHHQKYYDLLKAQMVVNTFKQ